MFKSGKLNCKANGDFSFSISVVLLLTLAGYPSCGYIPLMTNGVPTGNLPDSAFPHLFVPAQGPQSFLLLHGTGGSETDLLPLGRALDPEAHQLSPRGRVSENGAARFFRRFAEGVFDLEDMRLQTEALADFLRAAARHHRLDLQQMTAVGYSNGANIASSLLLRFPGLLRQAILLRPMVPFQPDPLPDLRQTRLLLLGGDLDPIAPPAEVARLHQLYTRCGAQVDLVAHPTGHGLHRGDVTIAQRWLDVQKSGLP